MTKKKKKKIPPPPKEKKTHTHTQARKGNPTYHTVAKPLHKHIRRTISLTHERISHTHSGTTYYSELSPPNTENPTVHTYTDK